MTWVAGGVFTPQLHKLDEDADTMRLDGRRYWWSRCTVLCVPLPPEIDASGIPLCPKCFPESVERVQSAQRAHASADRGR